MVQNYQKKIIKYILLIVIFLFAIYVNISTPTLLSLLKITPDIYIGLLVLYAINLNKIFILLFSFFMGFVVDAHIGFLAGLHSFLFLLISFFIIKIRNYIYEHSIIIKLILILIASFFYRIVYVIIILKDISLHSILYNIILSPIYTLIFFIIIEIIINLFKNRQKYE